MNALELVMSSSCWPAASCGMGSQGTTHGRGSHVGTFGPHGHNNHTTRAPRTLAPYILVDESNDVPDSPIVATFGFDD